MGSPAQICFRWHPCQLNPYTRLAVGWLAWVRVVIKGESETHLSGMACCLV